MARRRKSVLDVLLVLPWWACAIAAAISYLLLMFAMPAFLDGNQLTADLGSVGKDAAPYAAAFFVALGLASWLRAIFVEQRFHSLDELADLRRLSRLQLESLLGEAYCRRGYAVLEYAGGLSKARVDLVLRKDGEKFFVQCRQWRRRHIGVKAVRELFDAVIVGDAVGGFIVSSGTFTQEARDFAGQSSIQLIDGDALAAMIEEARAPQPFMDPTIHAREPTAFGHREAASR